MRRIRPGAASIGTDAEMMFGKVYRPSRLLVPCESHMRRCSSTSSHPYIVNVTPHTCHVTGAQQGPSSTEDKGTTSRARTQTGSRPAESTHPSDTRATDGRQAADGGHMPLGTCRQGHHETHTPHDGKQSTASRFLTSAGRTAPDTDTHTDTHAHTKGRGCLEHPLQLELELKLVRRFCGVAIPGPRTPSRRAGSSESPKAESPHERRAGGGGASWRQRLATGPPERLTRGVEGGGGRREAAGRWGEGI